MLKDITLGQYFPSNTVVHRLDPRTKIVLCIVYIICLFQANTWLAYGLVLALTLSVMALSKIKPSAILKGLKPLIIIIALTCLLNLFYTNCRNVYSDIYDQPYRTYGRPRTALESP